LAWTDIQYSSELSIFPEVPAPRHTSFALHIKGPTGKLHDDLEPILPNTYPAAEFAAVSYIRGSLDAPKHLDPKDILILFPTVTGGGLIQFDEMGKRSPLS